MTVSKPTNTDDKLSPSFGHKDVTLHKEETLYDGYFKMKRYTLSHPSFSGKTIGPFTREIFERGHATICLPYDPIRNEVVLIEQFRPGPYVHGVDESWIIETVAGIIDDGQTPEEVAIRESQEEAGCEINKLIDAGFYYPTGGGSTESLHCYIGICDTSEIGGLHGLDIESEDIRAFTCSLSEAVEAALSGKITNMPLVVLLQWLALKKSTLDFTV